MHRPPLATQKRGLLPMTMHRTLQDHAFLVSLGHTSSSNDVYFETGQLWVSASADAQPVINPIPDQFAEPGEPLTVTATFTGTEYPSNGTGGDPSSGSPNCIAFIDWGVGFGKQPVTINGNTITAIWPDVWVGLNLTPTIYLSDSDGNSAQQSFHVSELALSVANVTVGGGDDKATKGRSGDDRRPCPRRRLPRLDGKGSPRA